MDTMIRIALLLAIAGCGGRCGSDAVEVDQVTVTAPQPLFGPYTPPNLATPWTMRTIVAGVGTPPKAGADGMSAADINGDGLLDWVSGWEEGSSIYIALHPGYEALGSEWPHVRVDSNPSVEDAMFADVDGDGRLDVVSASEGERLKVSYGPADVADLLTENEWTVVAIDASTNVQRYMQLAFADLDGDGRKDIISGGRDVGGHDGTLVWWSQPVTVRQSAGWTANLIADVEWAMTVDAFDADGDGDIDVAVSDRTGTLKGVRWHENNGTGGGWTNHAISDPTPGTVRMVAFEDITGDGLVDVIDGSTGTAGNSNNSNSIRVATGHGFTAWSTTALTPPSGVGDYHSSTACDLDRDGLVDLVVSYSSADGTQDGLIWLRQSPAGTYTQGVISGDTGDKFDNVVCSDVDGDDDLDLVTSEQNDELGMVWYENPSVDPE